MNRKKVMLLSTHDSHLGGHAWSVMQKYDKSKYDVQLVSLYSQYDDDTYAIIPNKTIYSRINRVIRTLCHLFYLKRGRNLYNEKYCYFNIWSFPVSVKSILRKYNNGYPDIIVLHWYDGYITPQIISKLYKLTGAKIVFVFTDEYPLGGGCHYPCECEGYKFACKNCPALKSHKRIAENRLKERIKLLRDIPKIVVSPAAGIEKAKQAAVFEHNTQYIRFAPSVELNTEFLPTNVTKGSYNIPTDAFVVMYGVSFVDEKRKGFDLFKEALRIVSEEIDEKIVVAIAGDTNNIEFEAENIIIKQVGRLAFNDLCDLYAASNVYVSSSIADTGPMMVAYSIACGTPVVAYPVGYAYDCVIHKTTGYLAEYESVRDLANGILYFYKNSEKQSIFRANCLQLNRRLSEASFYGNQL